MSAVHAIRLRGPWECRACARFEWVDGKRVEQTSDLPPPGRVRIPADWSAVCGAEFRGRARFRRRFHWPSRLTPRERLWLVFDEIEGSAAVWLNDQPVGEFSERSLGAAFDVTAQIEPTNVLLVEVSFPASGGPHLTPRKEEIGGIVGDVRLEVRFATD